MTSFTHTYGPVAAVQPQPRARHADEVWAGTPTAPWGSGRIPSGLLANDPRRTLFRTLLRRAEGVRVQFPDGTDGIVSDVILPCLGFDFWAEALVVTTPNGQRRVPVEDVRRIDIRAPRIEVGR